MRILSNDSNEDTQRVDLICANRNNYLELWTISLDATLTYNRTPLDLPNVTTLLLLT
jgi:hypothetical protein